MKLALNGHTLVSRYGLAKAIDICKTAGFDSMDYSLQCMEKPDDIFNDEKEYKKTAWELRKIADEKGFAITQTHAPFAFAGWNDPKTCEEFIFPAIRRSIEISAILGAKVAVVYVVLGLIIAVIGGIIIEKLHMEEQVEEFIRNAGRIDLEAPELTARDRLVYAKERVEGTFKKVFPYILVGVGIGAIIHNWIPEHWIQTILGSNNPFGVILAVIVGVPMYADIFGTIPVAEALLAKGAQLGTILSFMMAVTTLSLPSMVMLKKAIKPKLLGVFVAICVVGIVIVGYLFNVLQYILV